MHIAVLYLLSSPIALGTGQAPVKKYNEYLRDLIVNGRAKPNKTVSHHIPIHEGPAAYDDFKNMDGFRS